MSSARTIVKFTALIALFTLVSGHKDGIMELDPKMLGAIEDVNGRTQIKTGDNWCWINYEHTDKKLPAPIRSKPIFKYCHYQPILKSNGTEAIVNGWMYKKVEEEYLDELFGSYRHLITTSTHYRAVGYPEETVPNYYCRTPGCNVPVPYLQFLAYNLQMNQEQMMEVQKEVATRDIVI